MDHKNGSLTLNVVENENITEDNNDMNNNFEKITFKVKVLIISLISAIILGTVLILGSEEYELRDPTELDIKSESLKPQCHTIYFSSTDDKILSVNVFNESLAYDVVFSYSVEDSDKISNVIEDEEYVYFKEENKKQIKRLRKTTGSVKQVSIEGKPLLTGFCLKKSKCIGKGIYFVEDITPNYKDIQYFDLNRKTFVPFLTMSCPPNSIPSPVVDSKNGFIFKCTSRLMDTMVFMYSKDKYEATLLFTMPKLASFLLATNDDLGVVFNNFDDTFEIYDLSKFPINKKTWKLSIKLGQILHASFNESGDLIYIVNFDNDLLSLIVLDVSELSFYSTKNYIIEPKSIKSIRKK